MNELKRNEAKLKKQFELISKIEEIQDSSLKYEQPTKFIGQLKYMLFTKD